MPKNLASFPNISDMEKKGQNRSKVTLQTKREGGGGGREVRGEREEGYREEGKGLSKYQ